MSKPDRVSAEPGGRRDRPSASAPVPARAPDVPVTGTGPGHRHEDVPVRAPAPVQSGPEEPGAAPPVPASDVASLPVALFVDRYASAYYDVDYRSQGGNLSMYLTVIYPDGTIIDIHLDSITDAVPSADETVRQMAGAKVGDGGRVFPAQMNASTTPRLVAAKRSALEAMDEFNVGFIMAAVPAVLFIITMPLATMSGPKGSATRTSVRRLPFRAPAAATRNVFDQTLVAATKQNTMRHVFAKAEHGLAPLVKELGGESQVMAAAVNGLRGAAGTLPAAGRYEVVVMIAGRAVTVRGAVVEGIPRIATMFVRGGG